MGDGGHEGVEDAARLAFFVHVDCDERGGVLGGRPGFEVAQREVVVKLGGDADEFDDVAVLECFVVVWYPRAVAPRQLSLGVVV